jgi:tetratricopeptide (TPR) repeat protein
MIAASLGAAAAMEMGDSDKALKFYQLVLRNDPDQKDTDAQYKGLKKIVKMLKEADELLVNPES